MKLSYLFFLAAIAADVCSSSDSSSIRSENRGLKKGEKKVYSDKSAKKGTKKKKEKNSKKGTKNKSFPTSEVSTPEVSSSLDESASVREFLPAYEVWASDQSNSVQGQEKLGVKG